MTLNNHWATVQESVFARTHHSLVIIAEGIAVEVWATTRTSDGGDACVALSDVCAVQACAVFAVGVIFVTPAAVTTIPVTAGVVVVIIAIAVALPVSPLAITHDLLSAFIAVVYKLAVQALAKSYMCDLFKLKAISKF